jgi:hypothetical protein
MILFIYTALMLFGYGVLAIFILIGLVILYSTANEIIRYLINKPRGKTGE